MNALHSLVCLSAAMLLLSGCSDVHTEIDGSSESAFYESTSDLRESLPDEQKQFFDLGLVRLKQEHDREELGGMVVAEIVQAEIDHLEDTLMSRMDKEEKFEGYADEFRSDGKEVPESILRPLEEVGKEIVQLKNRISEARGEASGNGNS